MFNVQCNEEITITKPGNVGIDARDNYFSFKIHTAHLVAFGSEGCSDNT